jgi:protein-S-isoprenylcysteine O-methyltransferase Ste14
VITVGSLIMGLWFFFLAFWIVAAVSAKRSVKGTAWRGSMFRMAVVVGIVILLRVSLRGDAWHAPSALARNSPLWADVGVALCALGVGIAICARIYLGRNWGMPMSRREDPEFVTSGPYAFVRHPIYTGILLAITGTILVQWYPWIVLLGVFLAYFVYAAKVEERSMIRQFPGVYAEYMKRTKMLVPFVF